MVEIDTSKYDFHTPEHYAFRSKKGLDEDVIKEISRMKKEPAWMLEKRLAAYSYFRQRPLPKWGPDLTHLNFDDLYYYVRPAGKKEQSWDKVPEDIKKTFDKLGIPEAERKFLAGSTAQFESESVYHHLKKQWEEKGIIFTDMDTGLKEHPDIVEKYFGTVVPLDDNKFASLNSATWSGGSFVYIPKNTKCDIPLQAYFRINTEKLGQFERTMIICEEGSSVNYVEGCSAPVYTTASLHAAVVEIIAKKNSKVRYTTIQNWSNNVYNLVTKRAVAYENAVVEWLDGNIGCLTADSKVFVNDDVKNIQDVQIGELVYSLDQNFEFVRNKVIGKKRNDPRPVYELKTMNHRIIRATDNHPFLVLTKKDGFTRINWMQLKQIKKGDLVAISGTVPFKGCVRKIDYKQTRGNKKIKIPSESSIDLLWLFGFYIGDGYKDETRICFAVPKTDKSRVKVIKLLMELFGLECEEHQNVVVRFNSAALVDFFMQLGFVGNARSKRIPQWVFKLPKEQKLAFIEGYLDADGHRRKSKKKGHRNISLCSVHEKLLQDTKILAISCGLNPLKISKWTRVEKLKLGKEVKEYVAHLLYFGDRQINSPIAFVPVSSIEDAGEETTYDIEVEGTQNFVANGFVVHNSAVTQKYPSVILKGEGARCDVMSVAYAGKGQHQDTGAKAIHLAPNTSSKIIQKSVCKDGGRSSYRGIVQIAEGAKGAKSFVQCNAYLLDNISRSDTYPTIKSNESKATVSHEAKVGKIGTDKLFYLMSRGISEKDALAMIVLGFMESFTRELPMEYAVELNRLIQLQMEGAVG